MFKFKLRPGLLDILLAVIAKALILQIKNGKEQKNRNVKVVKLINITSSLCKPKELTSKHWWIYGEASKKLADDVIGLIHEITSVCIYTVSQIKTSVLRTGYCHFKCKYFQGNRESIVKHSLL